METEQIPTPPPIIDPNRQGPSGGGNLKKAAGPLAVIGILLAKFKGGAILLLKFLPVLLKTGGTMLISLWFYAQTWGWPFAAGFVLLIFVHECGHLLVAKRMGLRVGAPMFIPFVGALIMLKESPRNAWVEALIGIGGPLLGTAGAVVCYLIYRLTGNTMFSGLAYTGFFLNLFNLAPIGFLDGGRIVTALSPWFWLVGLVVVGVMMFFQFNFILLMIVIMSAPRLFSLFRKKTAEQLRYYEVTPDQRWIIGGMYFGLIAFLVLAMMIAHVEVERP